MTSWGGSDWSGGSGAWWGSNAATSSAVKPSVPSEDQDKWGSWQSTGSSWWANTPATSSTAETAPSAPAQTEQEATPSQASQGGESWASARGREPALQSSSPVPQSGSTSVASQHPAESSAPAHQNGSTSTASQQSAQKRAQSAPPTPAVPPRQDKWWLGVDDETRKKYTEEMREWLKNIDSSFTKYFKIIEDNYDTVDQICRLYAVDSKKLNPALKGKYVDPLFFEDNGILDPEHRRMFKKWFAKRMGTDFVDEEVFSAVATSSSQPLGAATSSSSQPAGASPVPASSSSAPVWVPPGASEAAGSASASSSWNSGHEASATGWGGGWSGEAWKGGAWGERGKDEKSASSPSETAWTQPSWGEWGSSSDRWK